MKQLSFEPFPASVPESCGCYAHELDPTEQIALVDDGWTRYSWMSEQELIDCKAMMLLRVTYPAVAELCDRMQSVLDRSIE